MTILIGLAGKKRSGKTTAAQVFEASGFKSLSFAYVLKEMLYTLLTCQGLEEAEIHRMLEGDLKETPSKYLMGQSPRYAMQTLGTDWGRTMIHEEIWVTATLNLATLYSAVVIPDVRFPNEAEAIRRRGGLVYRIDRPGLVSEDQHISEKLIDKLEVDGFITNTGTVKEFQQKVAMTLMATHN